MSPKICKNEGAQAPLQAATGRDISCVVQAAGVETAHSTQKTRLNALSQA
jgi:hypothetical protein